MSDKLTRLLFLSSYLPIDKMTNAELIPNPVGLVTVLGKDTITITAVTVLAEIYPACMWLQNGNRLLVWASCVLDTIVIYLFKGCASWGLSYV